MEIEDRVVGDVAVVTVTGEITLKQNRGKTLHDRIRILAQQGHRKVLVDLAGVSFVDSAGLGELVQASSTIRNHGGALKVAAPTGRLRDMLVLTRLTTVLGVYDDEAQALASFGA